MVPIKNSWPALALLIVDDEKSGSEMIGRIIGQKFPDFIIHIAENGKQGIELFKEHLPEIVITDIHMPVMDGVHMVREIKSAKKDTSIIVATGYSDEKNIEKFDGIGVTAYIVKPINLAKLFAVIESVLARVNYSGRASDLR